MADFQVGDMVKLKPCGPCMTVERKVGEQSYYCVWCNGNGEKIGNHFAAELLAPA